MLGAFADSAQARITVELVCPANDLEEAAPLLVVVDHHAQITVLRGVGLAVFAK
ncbi:hypothetical protein D3C75_1253220 [compost metagenome]